mmetsp:Transcript_7393/g.15367  ORF Transcript_7393/g.15367 Transcript_7393/m.15367 type:complete len:242 (-) Transcript_7393:195-920(-)
MLRQMAAAQPHRGLCLLRGRHNLWIPRASDGAAVGPRPLVCLQRGFAQAAGDAEPSEERKASDKDAAKPAAQSQGELLRQELAELQEKVKSKKHSLLLSLADFENTKKRFAKECENRNRGATVHFSKKMIDTFVEVDALTSRVDAKSDDLSGPCQAFHEGIVLTRDLYRTTLGRFGVQEFSVERGEHLASARHESVGTVEDASLGANTVAELVHPGWVLEPGASVLRKAQVKLASKAAEAE